MVLLEGNEGSSLTYYTQTEKILSIETGFTLPEAELEKRIEVSQQEYLESYQEPNFVSTTPDLVLDIDVSTPSMDYTDEELRVHLIDEFYLKYDIPIIPYWDLALTTNWSNFATRVKFIEAVKKEVVYLRTQSNGATNSKEKARIKNIVLNIAEIQTVYEESSEFIVERFKDKVKDAIDGISLYGKIGIGVGVIGAVLFGSFVGYNFLKSYGSEKGKLKARGK